MYPASSLMSLSSIMVFSNFVTLMPLLLSFSALGGESLSVHYNKKTLTKSEEQVVGNYRQVISLQSFIMMIL